MATLPREPPGLRKQDRSLVAPPARDGPQPQLVRHAMHALCADNWSECATPPSWGHWQNTGSGTSPHAEVRALESSTPCARAGRAPGTRPAAGERGAGDALLQERHRGEATPARQEVGTAAAAAAAAQQQQAFRSKRGALAITIIRRSTMRCGKSHPSLSASLCLSLSSVSSPGSFHPDPDGVANAMAWHSSVAGLPRRERAGRRVPQPSSLPTSARPRGSTRVGSNKTKQRTRRPRQAPSSLRVAAGDRGRLTAGPGSEGGASARPGS